MEKGSAQLVATFPRQFVDIYSEVITNLRLDATADLAQVKNAVNQAYSEIALQSGFFEGSAATSALAGGATTDTIPTNMLELEDVTCTYAGIQPPLIEQTFEQILLFRTWTQAPGGPPTVYCVRKGKIEFWPAAQGTEVLTYYGTMQPDSWLSADSDLPLIPEPFSALLVYGACATMAEFKNDILMLGNYQQQKAAWMAQFLKFVEKRKGEDALAFPLRLGQRSLVPHDPSSDWWVQSGVPWR